MFCGDAPVQAYIAAMPGWKHDVGRRLDTLIVGAVPGAQGGQMELAAVRCRGPGLVPRLHCFTNYIKVAFFYGASLRPVPPGDSKCKDTRTLDIHEDDQLDEAQLTPWAKQASQLPGERV